MVANVWYMHLCFWYVICGTPMAILRNFGVTLQGLRFAVTIVGRRLKQCHTQAMQACHLRGC